MKLTILKALALLALAILAAYANSFEYMSTTIWWLLALTITIGYFFRNQIIQGSYFFVLPFGLVMLYGSFVNPQPMWSMEMLAVILGYFTPYVIIQQKSIRAAVPLLVMYIFMLHNAYSHKYYDMDTKSVTFKGVENYVHSELLNRKDKEEKFLIQFTHKYCSQCKKQLLAINEIAGKPTGIKFTIVHSFELYETKDKTIDTYKTMLSNFDVEVVLDTSTVLTESHQIRYFPVLFLISNNEVRRITGYGGDMKKVFEDEFKQFISTNYSVYKK